MQLPRGFLVRIALTPFLIMIPTVMFADGSNEIRDFDLPTISELGEEIYRVDQIAADATDILFEQGLDLSRYPVRGWVVTEDDKGALVTFVGEFESGIRGVFDVRPQLTDDSRFKVVERRALSKEELSRFRARQTVQASAVEICSERYNFVVLPDPQSESWLVYLLAATMEADLILAGGHYRFTVSSDGETILNTDRLSNSCLTLRKSDSSVIMIMSHIVSQTPIETHVFLSLLHKIDFAISTTDETLWKVSGEKISKLKR